MNQTLKLSSNTYNDEPLNKTKGIKIKEKMLHC